MFKHNLLKVLSVFAILAMVFSNFQAPSAQAQGGDGLKRQTNGQSHRVSFISPSNGKFLPAAQALGTSKRPQDPGMALAKKYAHEFGLNHPEKDLSVKKKHENNGRSTVRYQQKYNDVPVMGGELIVNTDADGDLYSINGEVSPDLSLDTNPTIAAEEAKATALGAVAKWYEKTPEDFTATEPELWIFDESLLQPSTRPVELVWRMEVSPNELAMPVRELVLVNAQRGVITFHFNQVDTAWSGSKLHNAIPARANQALLNPGSTWYVATNGNDADDCATSLTPCATINAAIGKAATSGDTIKVAAGTYTGSGTEVVLINKSITITGGWNVDFSVQTGYSTVDGGSARNGIFANISSSTVALSRFIIQNSSQGIDLAASALNVQIAQTIIQANGIGIYDNNSGGTLGLNRVALINNTGNGIYNLTGNVTFTNSTVSGNHQSYAGSAISNIDGLINIQYSTITNNTGSVPAIYSLNGGAQIEIGNSILAGNTSADCWANITSDGYNIFGSSQPCYNSFALQPSDHLGVNPQLGIMLPDGYQPLLSGSPAIGAANLATCPATDQRGVARPQGGSCDIGAYEYSVAGAAASLTIVSGNNQHTAPNFAFTNPLKVVVLDSQGSPVPNVSVTFTAPSSGASGTFADTGTTNSVDTDVNGIATTSIFTANDQLGAYIVTASASGATPANFDLANVAWFVSPLGNDGNSCAVPASPCLTINGAISKAAAGDGIEVAIGTYAGSGTAVVSINKNATLSGGWDTSFTTQSGMSTIDGQNTRPGVIVNSGVTANLVRFTIMNGYSGGYAGGVVNNGSLIITNSSIQNNSGYSGGIFNYYNSNLTLNNTTISNNSGSNGGGIYNNGNLTLNNTTISNNSASSYGGGIYNYSSLTLNNTTISNNSASYGGGGIYGSGSLKNSLLSNNTATSFGPNCAGSTFTSDGYNLLGDNSGCTFTSTTGDQVGTSASPIKPRMTPLQDNGGSTFTHALMEGSPAIDAGNLATCLPIDQRGVARPVGSRCDIGAYEGSVAWVPGPMPLVSTYTAKYNYSPLPGTFLCNQTKQTCTSGDAFANAAHKYAIGVYNFYAAKHLRDSIDNSGMVIKSSVHYCGRDYYGNLICPYDNAFWDGEQMIYGDAHRWPMADDIVAHELTHGVTQYESNLFYYYQSGAISESLSDLWGEYYDQTNGQGNDSREVRWLIGEDLTTNASFILRSMSNPPAYGDPDKMSSPLYQKLPYYDAWWDAGGVHGNSGINNKAVFLMVDGGAFNGKSVAPLGWEKTAAIYYEANTSLLSSGADYSDLYFALQQACVNLVEEKGITAADCAEVKNALDAVEMGKSLGSFNSDAPVCDSGKVPDAFFTEDFENGLNNWTINNGSYTRWQYDSPYGQYGQANDHFLYGDDYPQDGTPTDARARLVSFTVPSNAYLRFAHAYEFEFEPGANYDGGVVEYSVNNGSTWVDARSLMVNNGYNGTIYSSYNNPLRGKSAFVGSSHGYTSTRLNLSTLAGKTVSFRWRMGLDGYVSVWGWWLDNIQAYTCGSSATISGNAGAPNVLLSYVDGTTKTVLSKADGSYSIRVPSGWTGDVTPELACYDFDPPSNSYSGITGAQTSNYAAAISGTADCSDIHVEIAGVDQGRFGLAFGDNIRKSFTGLNNGPAVVVSKNDLPLVASQGVIFSGKSYSEMMGLPVEQLSQEYWFPSYNNVDLNSQLRVSNLGTVSTTIRVYLGNSITPIDSYILAAGGATRKVYNYNGGPLRVTSSATKILSTIRLLYNNISFSELMGLPKEQLTTSYLFPYYNNVAMTSNLQVSNVGGVGTTIKVYLGTSQIDTFSLPKGSTISKNYVGKNSGPLKVTSSVANIVPSIRVLFSNQSYSEMMGYPANQLAKDYWYPAYDNNMLDSQVRVSNVGSASTIISVYLGNTKIDSYTLSAGAATRKNYAKNIGALHIVSDTQPILTTIRMLYNTPTFSSFYEMMGMSSTNLSTQYIFPWYNNIAMNSEIRFAAP